MPNNNGRVGRADENRPSWSPYDERARDDERGRDRDRDDDRYASDRAASDRDRERWGGGESRRAPWSGGRESRLGRNWEDDRDEGYRMTERYGQGQSGYGAGRTADDRSQRYQNRNQGYVGSSFEDRNTGMGIDDRFSGRGGTGYWEDRQVRGYAGTPHHNMGYRGGFAGDEPMGYQGAGRGNVGRPGDGDYGQRYDARGGHRGKGPKGYARSDERIRELVSEALADDDYIDASHIEIAVKNGDVTMTGTVEDRRTKRMAEDCVERVSGVKDVQNQLRVQSESGNPSDGGSVSNEKKHRA